MYSGIDIYKDPKFKWESKKYQKWLDNFINAQTKPLVLVGLTNYPAWNPELYYNVHADYKFYIKLDIEMVFKQKCNRWIEETFTLYKQDVLDDLIENEKEAINYIVNYFISDCGFNKTKEFTKKWNKNYKKLGYKFLSNNDIIKQVEKILSKHIK